MRRATRSAAMNRYLFGVVYKEMARATGRTVADVHDLMTAWFLPRPTVRKLSNWPDGEVRTITTDVRHTSTLTPAEFQAFIDSVCVFARSLLGITIEPPGYLRFGDTYDKEKV
jgi:hypothetical protein